MARLHGESFSAFCPSSADDLPAVWGTHSSKEAVRSFSLAFVGLVCPFHVEPPLNSAVCSSVTDENKRQYSLRRPCCQVQIVHGGDDVDYYYLPFAPFGRNLD